MERKFILIFVLAITLLSSQCTENKTLMIVGSYTDGVPASGIKVYNLDQVSGETTLLSEVDSIINPSFIKISDDGQFLFVVSESQLETDGYVSSYSVDIQSGKLTYLNRQSTHGRNPVHIEIAPNQDALVVSNYTDPSISLYNIDKEGRITPSLQHIAFQDSSIIKGRQDQAHAHSSTFSVDGKYLYTHDLGADKVRGFIYKDTLNDEDLPDIGVPAGSGPRHFTFDQEGKYGYLLSELAGRLTAFRYNDQDGMLSPIDEESTYGKKQEIYRSADIHASPTLDMIYVSNRGPEENTIAVFKKSKDGNLDFVQRADTGGDHPRNFAIAPEGNLIVIANQLSNNIVIKRLNKETGKIEEVINELKFEKPSTVQIYKYH
jgi:6-phosphogluconolactonase (cycloisomerase 2 family)